MTTHAYLPTDDMLASWQATAIREGEHTATRIIPSRFDHAAVTNPAVQAWIDETIAGAETHEGRSEPRINRGRSLLLAGGTGTGKTFQAYGAVRAMLTSGVRCAAVATSTADLYAGLRPRPRIDSEEMFEYYAWTPLLMLDDLGAAKSTEWTEEVNYRLVNHRYEHQRPTIITTNVPPKNLATILGERVASRLAEMCTTVALKGGDRRTGGRS